LDSRVNIVWSGFLKFPKKRATTEKQHQCIWEDIGRQRDCELMHRANADAEWEDRGTDDDPVPCAHYMHANTNADAENVGRD
jgi:hypothetical protein